MNSVERVKSICKDRKIPISKLEKDLGYSNGYIGQLRKGVFPGDRLKEIAGYLDLSMEFLLNGVEQTCHTNSETADIAQEIFENKELRMLFDVAKNSTAKRLKAYHDMIKQLEEKENGE